MKLHLPSLQAAAAVASVTDKTKTPLRMVQVMPGFAGRGHRYLATGEGRIAICCTHHCHQVVGATTIGGDRIVGETPIVGTELPRNKRLLLLADDIPSKKPTKAEMAEGSWIDINEAAIPHWMIDSGADRVDLRRDGPPLTKEPGLTYLSGVPRLEQILKEFIPGNLHAGSPRRINATYMAALFKAAELMARGLMVRSMHGDLLGDTPSIEIFEDVRRETAQVFVDLTAQRWMDETLPQAWGLIMPIMRRDKDAQKRGIQPVEVAA